MEFTNDDLMTLETLHDMADDYLATEEFLEAEEDPEACYDAVSDGRKLIERMKAFLRKKRGEQPSVPIGTDDDVPL